MRRSQSEMRRSQSEITRVDEDGRSGRDPALRYSISEVGSREVEFLAAVPMEKMDLVVDVAPQQEEPLVPE